MPKCDFNKVTKQLIEIALRHGCSPVNILHIFRTPFLQCTSPTNAPRLFHVETTWKRSFNVEYTWSVCRVWKAAFVGYETYLDSVRGLM